MGACSLFMTVKTTDRNEIEIAYKKRVEDDIYNYGHDAYNGTFSTTEGIKIENITFKDEKEARKYILDNTEKWGKALAVTIITNNNEKYTLIGGWGAE